MLIISPSVEVQEDTIVFQITISKDGTEFLHN